MTQLPCIDEDPLEALPPIAEQQSMRNESFGAPLPSVTSPKNDVPVTQLRYSPNRLDFEPQTPELNSVQTELLQKLGRLPATPKTQYSTYQDQVVANFRMTTENAIRAKELSQVIIKNEGRLNSFPKQTTVD